jgi:hypothetical protein
VIKSENFALVELEHPSVSPFDPMPYTEEDGGRLNNFAIEPKMYQAQPPSSTQKRTYLIVAVVALTLVGGLIWVAAAVS